MIDFLDFILKVAYCNTLYWYDESKLLLYHFGYIFVFNTVSIGLMICVYFKYLKLKINEELDSVSLKEVRHHSCYVTIYRLQTLHIMISAINLVIFLSLGIVFIIDLLMYSQIDLNSDESTYKIRSIGLLTTINISPFLCH